MNLCPSLLEEKPTTTLGLATGGAVHHRQRSMGWFIPRFGGYRDPRRSPLTTLPSPVSPAAAVCRGALLFSLPPMNSGRDGEPPASSRGFPRRGSSAVGCAEVAATAVTATPARGRCVPRTLPSRSRSPRAAALTLEQLLRVGRLPGAAGRVEGPVRLALHGVAAAGAHRGALAVRRGRGTASGGRCPPGGARAAREVRCRRRRG